ncbi:MAG: histidine phosphatase family protein [Fimbriimonadaceae bacterium]|nr:histidine phosphatase family protein [Fimbriimonadaceae bacterium]
MRLYLVRHGETDWNVLGRAQGHTDMPLNDAGRVQAMRLAAALERLKIGHIVCSDLLRCRQTIAPFLERQNVPVEYRFDLRERSFGNLEGQPFTELQPRLRAIAEREGLDLTETRPPNGESFNDVWRRLDRVVAELATESRPTVVVTHGGTGTVLLAKLLHGSLLTARGFKLSNTGLCELERTEDRYVLRRYNDTIHLLAGSGATSVAESGR